MKNKHSKRARLLAMLLCLITVIQSFSYVNTLSFSSFAAVSEDGRVLSVYYSPNTAADTEEQRHIFYNTEECLDGDVFYTGTIESLLSDSVTEAYDTVNIYMLACYTTSKGDTIEPIHPGQTVTIYRHSSYTAKYKATTSTLIAGSAGSLLRKEGKDTTLTLKNIVIDGGSTDGLEATSAAVYVREGHLILDSGTHIRYNDNVSVPVSYGGASSQLDRNGGGVFVYANTTIAEDGTIVREYASLTLNDGVEIYGNRAAGKRRGFGGGGIFTLGPVVMNGGEIYNNEASTYPKTDSSSDTVHSGGGGVMVFSKEGQYVNEESVAGGHDYTPASFTMLGGSIHHNSGNLGGGVFSVAEYVTDESGNVINNSFVRIGEGALIYENTSFIAGGGVYSGEATYLIMDGGEIFENICTLPLDPNSTADMLEHGGGLFFNGILLEFNGGTIHDNIASKRGDFYYFTNSDQTNLTKESIKYTMFGKEVGWMRKNQNPMQELVQVSIDLTDSALGTNTGYTPPIQVTKIKTSLNTYTGSETFVDFYTTNDGKLYLWLEPGEFVEDITITDGTDAGVNIEEPQDRRPQANIHYDFIGVGRKLVAQLENAPTYVDKSKLHYDWQYQATNDANWLRFTTADHYDQIFTLTESAIEQYKIRVHISYTADGHTLEWYSREVEIKDRLSFDGATGQRYEYNDMPKVAVAKYVRPGTIIERFITGYDDLLEADGQSIPTNGSYTIHFEFDHFHFTNFRLFLYIEDSSSPNNVFASGARALPAGTRLIFTDVCCCYDDSVISEYSHDTYGDAYVYTLQGESSEKIISIGPNFRRVGDPDTPLNELTDIDDKCRGYSRYQLTVILPPDCTEELSINTAVATASFHSSTYRISNSTTRVQTKNVPGSAELTATGADATDGTTNIYSADQDVTVNVTTSGVTATATIIESDRDFPKGTQVFYGDQQALISGRFAIFQSVIEGETVHITGLDEQVYTLTVHTSRAEDGENPLAVSDILATSASVSVQTIIDRIKVTLVTADGMTEKDTRFIPYGTARTMNFSIEKMGLAAYSGKKLAYKLYKKNENGEYKAVNTSNAATATVHISVDSLTAPGTATVISDTTTPMGTYRIVFRWGTATYNYNFIVHAK